MTDEEIVEYCTLYMEEVRSLVPNEDNWKDCLQSLILDVWKFREKYPDRLDRGIITAYRGLIFNHLPRGTVKNAVRYYRINKMLND